MTARGDARERQATPSEAGTLTEVEHKALWDAWIESDVSRGIEWLTPVVARIKAEAVQAERERISALGANIGVYKKAQSAIADLDREHIDVMAVGRILSGLRGDVTAMYETRGES